MTDELEAWGELQRLFEEPEDYGRLPLFGGTVAFAASPSSPSVSPLSGFNPHIAKERA